MHPFFRHLVRAGTLVACAAALAWSPAAAQQPPDDPTTPTTEPVPGGSGVVQSWALTPGEVGETGNGRSAFVFDLAAGGEVSDAFTVFNFGNVPLDFRIYATDAFNADDGSFSLLAGDEEPSDVGTWVDLPLDALNVPPGQQATFPFTIRVPADAAPGDHVGAILASSVAEGTGPDGRVVNLDRRTGTRIYVRVAGDITANLAVEDLETTYDGGLSPLDGHAEVSYRIVNRGNVRLLGTHRISVGGPFGLLRQTSEEIEIPELLPGESVEFTQAFDDVAASGLAFTDVDIDPVAPEGSGLGDLAAEHGRASTLAIPVSVVAILLVVPLLLVARRSFLRHRTDGVAIEAGA